MEDIKDLEYLFSIDKEYMQELSNKYYQDQKDCTNKMGYWLDKFVPSDKIHIPKTKIVSVPKNVIKAFFMDNREKNTATVKDWIKTSFKPVIDTDFKDAKTVFIKNGCVSNKFNFNASCKLDDFSIENIFEHIMSIEELALMHDTMGDAEFVIREYIKPSVSVTIYNGMPLRPEMRVFYDFTKHEYLYQANYWEYNYLTSNLEGKDLQVFKEYYPKLEALYNKMVKENLPDIIEWLGKVDMEDIWSVDFMREGNDVYFIDAADAYQSAYWDINKINDR